MLDVDKIKKLREKTSLGIAECKKALIESGGDFDKAMQILKEKGISIQEKRQGRNTTQGLIDAYVHFGGNLAAMVEVNCETDFVAKTEVFKQFVKDLAMQVAAAGPSYLSKEEIPAEEMEKHKEDEDYFKQKVLLEQPFIKNPKQTIKDYLQDVISQTGENIRIARFVRYSLSEQA